MRRPRNIPPTRIFVLPTQCLMEIWSNQDQLGWTWLLFCFCNWIKIWLLLNVVDLIIKDKFLWFLNFRSISVPLICNVANVSIHCNGKNRISSAYHIQVVKPQILKYIRTNEISEILWLEELNRLIQCKDGNKNYLWWACIEIQHKEWN